MRYELAMIVLASAWALEAHATPATTLGWGLHDPVETASIQPKGHADDFIQFSLDGALQLFSTAVSNVDGATGKKGGTVYLYQETGAVDDLLFKYDFDAVMGSASYAFEPTAEGEYFYRVVSTGPGASGGAYTLSSWWTDEETSSFAELALAEVTEVPEPQGPGLVLAGLAAIGWVSRRRKA
jgi:hypothetical protein